MLVSAKHQPESVIGIHILLPFESLLSYPIPLGCHRAPDLSSLSHTANFHWLSISHVVVYMESDTTERLHFHFSLSCIGEGDGNPLQYSCLEDPRDRGAWWAAVYGVAQSRRRLKGFSGGSSSSGVHGKPILLSASHEQALYFHVLWPLLILRRINPVRIINAHFTDKKTKAWGG